MNLLYHGDCLNIIKDISDKSIDLIYTDLPFGTINAKWDNIIPFDKLWEQYERIIKDDGVISLHATQPFTTDLINSNRKLWRYNWFWEKTKNKGANFMNAKNCPIKIIEEICIFSKNKIKHVGLKDRLRYNPQNLIECNKEVKGDKAGTNDINFSRPSLKAKYVREFTNYPSNLLTFKHEKYDSGLHSTQKPLALCEYIIKTYTNEGDIVLDNAMGAGTIPLAALKNNRKFIGIDIEEEYYLKSLNRLFNYQINAKLE